MAHSCTHSPSRREIVVANAWSSWKHRSTDRKQRVVNDERPFSLFRQLGWVFVPQPIPSRWSLTGTPRGHTNLDSLTAVLSPRLSGWQSARTIPPSTVSAISLCAWMNAYFWGRLYPHPRIGPVAASLPHSIYSGITLASFVVLSLRRVVSVLTHFWPH